MRLKHFVIATTFTLVSSVAIVGFAIWQTQDLGDNNMVVSATVQGGEDIEYNRKRNYNCRLATDDIPPETWRTLIVNLEMRQHYAWRSMTDGELSEMARLVCYGYAIVQ